MSGWLDGVSNSNIIMTKYYMRTLDEQASDLKN